MRRLALLVIFASAAIAAPVPKALKAKPASIGGSWTQIEQSLYGREQKLAKECIWEIDPDTLKVREPDVAFDPKARTIRFSKVPELGEWAYSYRICCPDGTEEVYPARIEIVDDCLRIAFSVSVKSYPADTQPSKSAVLIVFKRSEK